MGVGSTVVSFHREKSVSVNFFYVTLGLSGLAPSEGLAGTVRELALTSSSGQRKFFSFMKGFRFLYIYRIYSRNPLLVPED